MIIPSESNYDLLEGQIFIHVTILLYLVIAKQGTFIYVWFLHFSPVFRNPLGRTLTFQLVTRISLVQTIAYTLCHGLTLLTKIVFQIFCMLDQKDYNPCLMITVLYYLSSKLDSEPAYLRTTNKIIQDNTIEYWDFALFCIFISNRNSLKCIGHVSTLFCLGYEIANSFSQQMYSQMTLSGINPDIINHSL